MIKIILQLYHYHDAYMYVYNNIVYHNSILYTIYCLSQAHITTDQNTKL